MLLFKLIMKISKFYDEKETSIINVNKIKE